MHILIIGQVWPEPASTAAGRRMHELIELFHEAGHSLTFASAAQKTPFSQLPEGIAIDKHEIELNSSSFDVWVKDLNPEMVVFDRFMTEEQFGWRVAAAVPNALRVLDTEDLHFLRQHRELIYKNQKSENESPLCSTLAYREIASIYRCDLSLIISQTEMHLLLNEACVPASLLHYLPYCRKPLDKSSVELFKDFDERAGFVSMGSFNHAPNRDAVGYLKEQIWPLIRQKLPGATLHVYGSYCRERDLQLTNRNTGFIVCGRAADALETIQRYRILLAPLRFGAGLKGKIADAMQCGTPCISTAIGFEGMNQNNQMANFMAEEPESFAEKAIKLHENPTDWYAAQTAGIAAFNMLFADDIHHKTFIQRVDELRVKLQQHRTQNLTGQMLMHHRMQSTRYMAKWIEEKNRNGQSESL
jgi:glycosyltransferase involved in cell wall biosynthesis